MPNDKIVFKRIFHPSDFSAGGEGAWIHALKIALATQGNLSLLHVSPNNEGVHWSNFPHIRPTLKQWGLIDDISSKAEVTKAGIDFQKVAYHDEDPVNAILRFLTKHRQDLVVLSTRQRRGLSRWINDAIAAPIARSAQAMTLFVPRRVMGFVAQATGELRLNNILIPITKPEDSLRSAQGAAALASALGAEKVCFTFLYVGVKETALPIEMAMKTGWSAQSLVVQGSVVDQILGVAEDYNADLIVMKTEGHKGFLDILRGSISERVLRGTKCPILAIPQYAS